jgi:hypothetical protein
MFIQVIQGKAADPAGIRAMQKRWSEELAPGAEGWLGVTSGTAADGEHVTVARFASEEAARRNSDRPEQGEWWNEMSKNFAGEVTFHDTTDVETFGRGGSDDAGFVQIIQGKAKDPARTRALFEQFDEPMRAHRPEVIGGTVAWYGDGEFTQTVYFTSEKEAREGEAKQRPPELEAFFTEWQNGIEDVRFIDLTDPWLVSP